MSNRTRTRRRPSTGDDTPTGLVRRLFRRVYARMQTWTRPRDPEPLPVQFVRQRIYVLPTAFGLFYAALLFSMVIGALNFNNNPALLLALMLAGAGLTSLVGGHLQLAGLTVVAIEAEPVAAGSPITLRLHAHAHDQRRRRGLRVAFAHADGTAGQRHAVLNLEQNHGEAALDIETERRGWLELPRLRVSTTRPLGLARAWAYAWPDAPLLVYPAPEAHGPALPEGAGQQVHTRLHPTGDDVHHLRAYRAGDARRAIAWKHSARRDTLLVREYEQPLGAEVVLAWNALSGLPYEGRIARLARWVDEAEREGRRYRLDLPTQPALGPDQGAQHRHACLRALALLPHG